MIYNFNNLAFDLYLQRQELCVISYGGSCSNALVDVLERNGYRIRTDLWRDILCHCPVYFDMNIPVIYIYDNPINLETDKTLFLIYPAIVVESVDVVISYSQLEFVIVSKDIK